MTAAPAALYSAALLEASDSIRPDLWLRFRDGRAVMITEAVAQWRGRLDAIDRNLLRHAHGAVLDVGCGPGRFVAALSTDRRIALGVDIVETAVTIARSTGSAVLHRSVFDRLPGEGRWDSVLLADGNIGIGGDPSRLLRRCRELINPTGRILVELDRPDGQVCRTQVRLEAEHTASKWFDWATVGADAIEQPAAAAGLAVTEQWQWGERWFAALTR